MGSPQALSSVIPCGPAVQAPSIAYGDSPSRSEVGTHAGKPFVQTAGRGTVHQVNSSHQLWRVERQKSRGLDFRRGFFWGNIIGLTAVFSALFGVAITKIDTVERLVAQIIGANRPVAALTDKVDVLLVEFQPNANEMQRLSSEAVGKSETISLLRFQPNLNSARIIDIPLDTKVEILNLGTGTVADAYQLGGMELLVQTIDRLMNDSAVDGYVLATPMILQRSLADNRITVNQCDRHLKKCSDEYHVVRQKNNFESIRQHLRGSYNLDSFKTAVTEIEPMVDTNISVPEIMSLANFVKELEPNSISVDLLPGYIPGESIYTSD